MQQKYTPSYPDLMEVQFAPGEHNSSLRAKKSFSTGDIIADLSKAYLVPQKTRFTVQVGVDQHIELGSDLVYMNHSCEPNAAFDVSSGDSSQWKAIALKDIAKGSELTFFYPSTEWDAAEPFECKCGTESCLKIFQGANSIATETLKKQAYISRHIWQLVEERDGGKL
ncbi:hypothetical protein PQX77_018339 [Marasmius sp. AFHP31]|nr:hypothetical protein PQX77_018339 [Marasmius sp. AFHP31]